MTITLAVTPRDEAQTINTLRVNGVVPAVVYGPKQESVAVTLVAKDFDKVLKAAGESTIISLTGLANPIEVLIKDVAFDPVKEYVLHADFYAIERGKEMTVNVPLHFINESPAEASKKGTITKVLHEVEVTCRPSVLPSHIDVDLSVLTEVDSKIHVSDLQVATGITIDTDADETVVVVSGARVTESDDEAEAAVDMDAIEVEKKGKEEAAE